MERAIKAICEHADDLAAALQGRAAVDEVCATFKEWSLVASASPETMVVSVTVPVPTDQASLCVKIVSRLLPANDFCGVGKVFGFTALDAEDGADVLQDFRVETNRVDALSRALYLPLISNLLGNIPFGVALHAEIFPDFDQPGGGDEDTAPVRCEFHLAWAPGADDEPCAVQAAVRAAVLLAANLLRLLAGVTVQLEEAVDEFPVDEVEKAREALEAMVMAEHTMRPFATLRTLIDGAEDTTVRDRDPVRLAQAPDNAAVVEVHLAADTGGKPSKIGVIPAPLATALLYSLHLGQIDVGECYVTGRQKGRSKKDKGSGSSGLQAVISLLATQESGQRAAGVFSSFPEFSVDAPAATAAPEQ